MTQQDEPGGISTDDPADGGDNMPAPEEGSPTPGAEAEEDDVPYDKGDAKANPLAPPINVEPGS